MFASWPISCGPQTPPRRKCTCLRRRRAAGKRRLLRPYAIDRVAVSESVSRRAERIRPMDLIRYFEQRKRECEESILFAQNTPGFRLFQVVAEGPDVDITAQHIE